MLSEVNEAKQFLLKKFINIENIKPGIYAIPTQTSKGLAYMKVEITSDMSMKDFSLYKDEALTESWYDKVVETLTSSLRNKLGALFSLPQIVRDWNKFPVTKEALEILMIDEAKKCESLMPLVRNVITQIEKVLPDDGTVLMEITGAELKKDDLFWDNGSWKEVYINRDGNIWHTKESIIKKFIVKRKIEITNG